MICARRWHIASVRRCKKSPRGRDRKIARRCGANSRAAVLVAISSSAPLRPSLFARWLRWRCARQQRVICSSGTSLLSRTKACVRRSTACCRRARWRKRGSPMRQACWFSAAIIAGSDRFTPGVTRRLSTIISMRSSMQRSMPASLWLRLSWRPRPPASAVRPSALSAITQRRFPSCSACPTTYFRLPGSVLDGRKERRA